MEDLEAHLARLVDELEPLLSAEPMIRHFIEHREYGLCFEFLCEALQEQRVSVLPAQMRAIAQLGREMEFEPETWADIAVTEDPAYGSGSSLSGEL